VGPVQGQLWWRNDPDGVLYIYYNDGTSSQFVPATPTASSLWTVSGAALTPTDATKAVRIPATGTTSQLVLGPDTVKSRVRQWASNGDTELSSNRTDADGQDDPARPSWTIVHGSGSDKCSVFRKPPGGAWATLLALDSAGKLTLAGSGGSGTVQFATGANTTRLLTPGMLSANYFWSGTWQRDDPAYAGWYLFLNTGSDSCTIVRNGGTEQALLTLSNIGNLTIFGATATKASGTTWINPSDIRLKKDITPYAHGLADILQLEPISYTLKATDQQTCGLDAAQVQTVFPECVGTTRMKLQPEDEEETEVLTLDIHPILIALINAVKELNEKVQ
jgi:hypothetical protein